jgi:hypothetical protein
VVDLATGTYKCIFKTPMENLAYSAVGSGNLNSTIVNVTANTLTDVTIVVANATPTIVNRVFDLIVIGGKS